jgi:hypothetical protein
MNAGFSDHAGEKIRRLFFGQRQNAAPEPGAGLRQEIPSWKAALRVAGECANGLADSYPRTDRPFREHFGYKGWH